MVNEDDLEGEVEQADVIRERIGMCIMDIDDALDSDAQKGDPTRATPTADPTGCGGMGISSATVSTTPTVSVAATPTVSVTAMPTVSVTAAPR